MLAFILSVAVLCAASCGFAAVLDHPAAADAWAAASRSANARGRLAAPADAAQCEHPKYKNGTMVSGAEIYFKLQWSLPPAYTYSTCCSVAGSVRTGSSDQTPWTVTLVGPSKKHPGQVESICTVYQPSGAKVVSAPNSTTAAGSATPPPPPPPPPPCSTFTTIEQCPEYCAWVNPGKCASAAPIECGDMQLPPSKWKSNEPSLCFNLGFLTAPYVTGPPLAAAPAKQGPFNWTSGEVTTYAKILVKPPQLLHYGDSTWFSFASGFYKNASAPHGISCQPWAFEVTYNQLEGGKATAEFFKVVVNVGCSALDISGPVGSKDLAFHASWQDGGDLFYGRILLWKNTTGTVSQLAQPSTKSPLSYRLF